MSDLTEYQKRDAEAKVHAFELMLKARDLAWANVRKLEWDIECLTKELQEAKDRTEYVRHYYMELLKKHGIKNNDE